MIKILLRYAVYGLAMGSLYLLAGLILLDSFWYDGFYSFMQNNFTANILGGLGIGIVTSVSGIVHEFDNLNPGLQAVIRAIIVLVVAISIAFGLGWISFLSPTVIVVGVVVCLLLFVVSWFGFYLFGDQEVKKINDEIKARNSKE